MSDMDKDICNTEIDIDKHLYVKEPSKIRQCDTIVYHNGKIAKLKTEYKNLEKSYSCNHMVYTMIPTIREVKKETYFSELL